MANNSWRTNNLKGWSMGGTPRWEHPQQHPPGSAHRISPQLVKAEAALPRQRCGVALVEEFSWPQCQTHGPPDPPRQAAPLPAGSSGVRAAVGVEGQALALFLPHAQFMATQVVIEGLHVGEDALGVRLLPHDHHVFNLHQRHAVHQRPSVLGGLTMGYDFLVFTSPFWTRQR